MLEATYDAGEAGHGAGHLWNYLGHLGQFFHPLGPDEVDHLLLQGDMRAHPVMYLVLEIVGRPEMPREALEVADGPLAVGDVWAATLPVTVAPRMPNQIMGSIAPLIVPARMRSPWKMRGLSGWAMGTAPPV